MVIECRGETLTKCGWPESTGGLDQLLLSLREKGQDAKPEGETLSIFDFSSIRSRVRSRIHDERSDDCKNLCSEREMQILRVCKSWGQFRAWVPEKQLKKVVDEATKLRPGGFAQQSSIRGGSVQSGTVDLFDENVRSINLPGMGSRNGAAQVLSAAPT
jgi:hypothetical protein